jgi:flagella basal body P-ring formation protein FlgA
MRLLRFMGGEREDLSVKLQKCIRAVASTEHSRTRWSDGQGQPATTGRSRQVDHADSALGRRSIVATRSAAFDIRKRQKVAVAAVALTRDKPIDERSVQFERRFVSTTLDELDGSQVFGQRVRTNIVPGTILQARDFQTTPAGARIMIKKGDLVTAYARAGKLQTRLRNVEALQDAGIGDNIKLLNRESDNLFSGKVMSPGTVMVIIER